MRKRLLSVLLLLALVMTMLPIGVQAAGVRTPIYLGYAGVDYMAEEILKEIPLPEDLPRSRSGPSTTGSSQIAAVTTGMGPITLMQTP